MRIVHFTELRHMKVTGQIERGMRYLRCHDSRHRPEFLIGSAYASEILTMGHIIPTERDGLDGTKTEWRFRYISTEPRASWMGERRIDLAYAADCGIEAFPGAYGNDSNFLLDIAALRREGIVVDTTFIPRDPNIPPLYDPFDSYDFSEDEYYSRSY